MYGRIVSNSYYQTANVGTQNETNSKRTVGNGVRQALYLASRDVYTLLYGKEEYIYDFTNNTVTHVGIPNCDQRSDY